LRTLRVRELCFSNGADPKQPLSIANSGRSKSANPL
jgi:hypothetical protein